MAIRDNSCKKQIKHMDLYKTRMSINGHEWFINKSFGEKDKY